MHRIIKNHLESFVSDFGLGGDEGHVQFEKFSAYCVITKKYTGNFDLDKIITSDEDRGIDSIAMVINESVITSEEEAADIFNTHRKNNDVDIIFTQAKTSEKFDLGDFLKFKEGILSFINDSTEKIEDETLNEAKKIFDLILKEVSKIKNGKPSITIRYITTGQYYNPEEFEYALKKFNEQLNEIGYFSEIDIKFVDRDELTNLWISTYSAIEAKLPCFSQASLPDDINGIDEAYLAVVKAEDFVKNLLLTNEGGLRTQVFEENVRSFLGSENPVNASISETLKSPDSSSRFPVLNNGITIVSPDVKLQGTTLHLSNFQIINGCQTSNVLFRNREHLNNIMVNVKVIETKSEDVFSDLVRATNNQTKIEDTQFNSLLPIVKKIEQFFNTFEGEESRLYFERRDKQYVGQSYPAIRIFSIHQATRCVAAMFCQRPDLAARYPKTIFDELGDEIFSEKTKEAIFYAACLTMYRLSLLLSNKTIQPNASKFKWHILALIKAKLVGKKITPLNSKSIEKEANKIIETMEKHNKDTTSLFQEIVNVCLSIGDITRDQIKRKAILDDLLKKI